jgi:hypothetical protein
VWFSVSFPVNPLAKPIASNTAGTACPTMTKAPKPKKIQPINPVFSTVPVVAAKAAAGANPAIVAMMVVSVLMTSSFGWWWRFRSFVNLKMHRRCQGVNLFCTTRLTNRYHWIFYYQNDERAVDPGGNGGAGVYDPYTASATNFPVKPYGM